MPFSLKNYYKLISASGFTRVPGGKKYLITQVNLYPYHSFSVIVRQISKQNISNISMINYIGVV